ncbi:hypothetical protein JD78_01106 [Modestobacter roseus]|uniref:Uncharacterized protein n=1 Tax=Modestobacter roseus TaxID=1181884 RepID=A0A562INX6_9ACTN|nr:hypothetical protein [Modestobacter roseus]TWH72590.1 hypothetical protein JD78_01106 [Modestobacter roseus]
MTAPSTAPPSPLSLGAAAVLLTAAAGVVGSLDWPAPRRTMSGWQVADVPTSLLALVVGTALVCLTVAATLTRPWALGSTTAAATWVVLAAASTFAQGWNDVYFAALGSGEGPVIPVFDWLFTFVPVLLVGVAARPLGRRAHLRATLGMGTLVLPLLALGWALYDDGGILETLLGSLYAAAVFGVVPLLIALAITLPRNRRATPVG